MSPPAKWHRRRNGITRISARLKRAGAQYSSRVNVDTGLQASIAWLKSATHLFYTWHCYGCNMKESIANSKRFALQSL